MRCDHGAYGRAKLTRMLADGRGVQISAEVELPREKDDPDEKGPKTSFVRDAKHEST